MTGALKKNNCVRTETPREDAAGQQSVLERCSCRPRTPGCAGDPRSQKEAMKDPVPRFQREHGPCPHLDLDFWPPEPR